MTSKPLLVLRHLARAMILATGFGTLWFIIINVIGESLFDVGTSSTDWPPRETLAVRLDGTPLIASKPRGVSNASYRDLKDNAMSDVETHNLVDPVWLGFLRHESNNLLFDVKLMFATTGWEDRLKLFIDDQNKGVRWYFIHDGKSDGTGYFVGFDRANNRPIGYIGRSGFSSGPVLPGDCFPVRLDLMKSIAFWSAAKLLISRGTLQDHGVLPTEPSRFVYVPARNQLCVVDLSRKTVQTIFESPEIIESFTVLIESPPSVEHHPIQVVRTTGHLHVMNREHEVLRTFPLPTETDRLLSVAMYEIGNGDAFVAFDGTRICDDERNIVPTVVFRIAADGSIVDRVELTLESGMLKWHKQSTATVFRWALPIPIVLPLVEPLMILLIDGESSFASAARSMLRNSWPQLTEILVLSSLLAAAAWRRARAFALTASEQLVWIAFILLSGLPGYVAFRLHRRWPLLKDCPRCRSRVPWDRDVCAVCRKHFPSAIVKGTEILCSGGLP